MADGLSCEECVAASGRSLAQVCYGLRGTALGRLFTQMYPGTACSRMHLQFKAAYREASQERMHPEFDEMGLDELAAAVDAESGIGAVEIPVETTGDPGFTRVDLSGPQRPRTMAAYA